MLREYKKVKLDDVSLDFCVMLGEVLRDACDIYGSNDEMVAACKLVHDHNKKVGFLHNMEVLTSFAAECGKPFDFTKVAKLETMMENAKGVEAEGRHIDVLRASIDSALCTLAGTFPTNVNHCNAVIRLISFLPNDVEKKVAWINEVHCTASVGELVLRAKNYKASWTTIEDMQAADPNDEGIRELIRLDLAMASALSIYGTPVSDEVQTKVTDARALIKEVRSARMLAGITALELLLIKYDDIGRV